MTIKFNIIKEHFIKVYTKEIDCDIPVEKIYIHNVDLVTHYIYNIDDITEQPINNNLIFKYRFVNLPVKKTIYIDKHFRFSKWNCDCIMYPFSKESEHLINNFGNYHNDNYTCIPFFTNEPNSNMYFLKANVIVLFETNENKTSLCYYISKKMYEAGIMNRKVNNKTSYLIDLLESDAIEKRNKKAEEALMVILNEPSKNNVDYKVTISELKETIKLYNYQKADIKWMTDIKEKIDRNENALSLNYTDYHKVILQDPYLNELKEYILFEGKLVNATIENKTMNINYIGGNIISEIGTGKCHAKDTPILMSDGSIKKVQDIKKGELLMGDNSKPRKVLSLARGQDIMYDIIPVKGEKYTVNQEHILCLKVSGKPTINITKGKYKSYNIRWVENNKYNSKNFPINKEIEAKEFFKNVKHQDIIEIAVKDYIKLPQNVKNLLKGYKVPIDFCEKELPLDAYMIGFWLGDGSSNGTEITNQDSTVIKYFKTNLEQYKCYLQYKNEYTYRINGDGSRKTDSNYFMNILNIYNLINNKHIPFIYKCNSRENRLKLLAGLIDSDGSLDSSGCYDFIQKSEKLIDDVIYVARSLGFACYKSKQKKGCWYLGEYKEDTYYRICISGNTEDIPVLCPRKKANKRKQKKDVLKTGITVKEVGYDDYYGFEIDGNRRYLMGDFTVTHNTLISLGYLVKNFTNEYDSFISFENTLCNYFYKRGKNKGTSCEKKKIDELYCKEHSKTIFIDKRKTIFNKIEIDKSFSLRDQIIEIDEYWNKKKLFKSNASLILCPNQLCDQWVREYYEKFKQSKVSKRILLIVTYDQYSNITFGELLFADIIIVSYDFLKNTNYLKRGNINRWSSRQNITDILDEIDNELNVELNEKLSENESETNSADLDLSVTRILDKFNVKLNILDNFYYKNIFFDEFHEIKDVVFNDTLKSFNSNYRWNITATPFANGLNSFINGIRNITNKNFDYIDDKIDLDIVKSFNKLYRRNTKESIKEEYTQTEITDTLKLLKFTEQERRIYDAHSLNKSNSTKDFLIKLCCDTSIDVETKNLVKNCKTLDEIETVILNHNKKKLQQLKKIIDEYTNKIIKLEEQVNIGFVPILGFNFENKIILTMEDLRTTLGNVRRSLTVNKKEYNEINRTYTFLKNAIENIKTSETCPICLDDECTDIAITKCGHKFCKDCIHEYVEEMGKRGDTKCPKCNIPIKIDEIYLLKEELELKVNTEDNNELSSVISRVKSTKIGNIIYFIKNCLKETDKCIIFSQWDQLLTKVGKLLKAENIQPLFCSGTIYMRKRSIKAFQEDPKSRIICLSSENCASGINLTAANKIIFLEPVYGSKQRRIDIENQGVGRSARIGNKRPIEVVRFIIKDTIEEDIYNDNEKELNYNIKEIVDTEPLELNGNILEI
jgi:hypothetical protein